MPCRTVNQLSILDVDKINAAYNCDGCYSYRWELGNERVNDSYPSENRISNLFTTKIFTISKDIVVFIDKISIELTDEFNLKLLSLFNIFENSTVCRHVDMTYHLS